MPKRRYIRVNYIDLRHLDRHGQTSANGKLEIDVEKKLRGKRLLEIIIHESMHELAPGMTEEEVSYNAATLARTLWREGWRKVDNHDEYLMQDEITK